MSQFGAKHGVEMRGKFAHSHGHLYMSAEDVKIATRIANARLGTDGVKRLPAP